MYQTTTARLHPTKEQRDVLFTMLNAGKMVYNRVRTEIFTTYRADKPRTQLELGVYENVAKCFADVNKDTIPISESTVRAVARDVYTSIISRPQANYTSIAIRKFARKTAESSMKILVDDVCMQPHYVQIPNVGKVRCNLESIGAFARGGFTVGKKTKAWISVNKHAVLSISFIRTVRMKRKIPAMCEDRILGLDYGLRELATLSTGEVLELPKKVYLVEKRMRFYQSKRDTAMKSSNSYKRWNDKYHAAYTKWRNLINGYCKNTATRLYRDYDIIVVEPLSVNEKLYHNRKNNRMNARVHSHGEGIRGYHAHNYNVLNSGLPELYKWLRVIADNSGKRLITTYSTFPSTQLCSVCGARNSSIRTPDIREWTCPNCGTVHDRDVNAARNMRAYGIRFMRNLQHVMDANGHNSCNVDTSANINVSEMAESHSSTDSAESVELTLRLQEDTVSSIDATMDSVDTPLDSGFDISPSATRDEMMGESDVSEDSTELVEGLQNCGVMTPLSTKTDDNCQTESTDTGYSRTSADDHADISSKSDGYDSSHARERIHAMLNAARNSRRKISVLSCGDTPAVTPANWSDYAMVFF